VYIASILLAFYHIFASTISSYVDGFLMLSIHAITAEMTGFRKWQFCILR